MRGRASGNVRDISRLHGRDLDGQTRATARTHDFSPYWAQHYLHFVMNNKERIRRRIERDKARRAAKRAARMKELDDYEKVFDFENIWRSGIKCGNGVRWKASVQRHQLFLLTQAAELYLALENGTWQKSTGKFCCFTLCERGHKRDIRSTRIEERNGQKCLCDYSLVPALQRGLIYDNGATMKDKGITFAEDRIGLMLRRFIQKVGAEEARKSAYVVLFDFHGYFDSIDHAILSRMIRQHYTDGRLIGTVEKLIADFGDRGLGLGSQISQILALAFASELDHDLKDRAGVKAYERYMDDGIAVLATKEEARAVLERIRDVAGRLRLELNGKKTRIVKLSRGFTFLKLRYGVTESGKVVRRIDRDGIKRMRSRLRAYRRKLNAGKILLENIEMSMEAYFANCDRADSGRTKFAFWKRFRRMFPESRAFFKRKRTHTPEDAVRYAVQWAKDHPGKNRSAFLADWREREREENNHAILQVGFKRKDR